VRTHRMSVAVVVCTSSRGRRSLLSACVESVLDGERPFDELIVVADGDRALEREIVASLPPSVHVLPSDRPGLSAARNTGLQAARSDIVAFLDDDARADARWLSSLTETLACQETLGAGGPVLPAWEGDRRWMGDELLWMVGCTYRGHRADAGPIRNPIGCNMAFRREELIAVGAFSTRFGKRGNALQTCDETELGLRVEQVYGAGRIRYVPGAPVYHFVPLSRISLRLLVRRSVSEGLAKGRLRRLYVRAALEPERAYGRMLLTRVIPRLLRDGLRKRDRQSVLTAGAILASTGIAAAAFVAGFAGERTHGVTQTLQGAPAVRDALD
jgi:glycosyltransferase involved in cell wall biosynthesis